MTQTRDGAVTPWTAHERATLDALFASLIPPLTDRGLPSGAEVGLLTVCHDAVLVEPLRRAVKRLDDVTGGRFAVLSPPERDVHIRRLEGEQVTEFREILRQLVARYYVDPRVVHAIGEAARPPFPDGHAVIDGDLTLLEPVYERGPLYRLVTEVGGQHA